MAVTYSSSIEGVDWSALKRLLAADQFDNGRTPEQMERAFRASYRCVFARDGERTIAMARALSDGVCNAYIVDMWTQSGFRRRGIGRRMLELLCTALKGQHVYLFTDDQQEFYAACGFSQRGAGLERIVGRWLENEGG